MLPEMRSACCSSWKGRCRQWCSLSATARGRGIRIGQHDHESSPKACHQVFFPTHSPMRSATSLSSRSPVSWPKVSLMGLKWSIDVGQGQGLLGACPGSP